MISCSVCFKKFSCVSSLNRHIRKIHKLETESVNKRNNLVCPWKDCSASLLSYQSLRKHIEESHHEVLFCEEFLFNSIKEFREWKCDHELKSRSRFIQYTAEKNLKDCVKTYYRCHRSGNYEYKPKLNRKRMPKSTTPCKILAACPSTMDVEYYNSNKIVVSLFPKHFGHSNEHLDLGVIDLLDTDRQLIAVKLKDGVPFDRILDDIKNGKENLSSKLKSIHESHKLGLTLPDSSINIISTGSFTVASASANGVAYKVTENFVEECDCKLICSHCEVCIHEYSCTCINYTIENNICKHIHQCVTRSKEKSRDVECKRDAEVTKQLISSVTNNQENNKNSFLANLKHAVHLAEQTNLSSETYKMLTKSIDKITNTLLEHSDESTKLTSKIKEPANNKMSPQMPFFSTKKMIQRENSLDKPSYKENLKKYFIDNNNEVIVVHSEWDHNYS